MKRWLRYVGLGVLVLGIAFGMVYESSTHVVRGWLSGEASFDGRPTSYWRIKVDHWMTQFLQPEDAVRCMIIHNGAEAVDGVVIVRPASHPLWGRMREMFQSPESREREWDTPEVLMGHPEAEPVLRELARDEKYRAIVERALK